MRFAAKSRLHPSVNTRQSLERVYSGIQRGWYILHMQPRFHLRRAVFREPGEDVDAAAYSGSRVTGETSRLRARARRWLAFCSR